MSQIYLRDTILPKDYKGGGSIIRRTIDEINTTLTDIVPRPLCSINFTKIGYVVDYPNESDANFFFNPKTIEKLEAKKLEARLHHDTQVTRELLILDIPEQIYKKDSTAIIPELEERNRINIIVFEKYKSEKTGRNYIKIALDSKAARDEALSKRKIKMFYANLDVQEKKGKNTTRQPTSSTDQANKHQSNLPNQNYPTPSTQHTGFT